MKKILLIGMAAVLAIGMVAVGCGGNGDGDERTTVDLSFVTFWPPVDFQADGDTALYGYSDMGHQAYMDEIEARVLAETDDYEIEWTAYYAGTVGGNEIYSSVAAGTYDIGATGTGYSPGVFPLHEVFNIPGNITRPNAYVMSLAKKDTVAEYPLLQAEYDAVGLHLNHVWSVGPGWFLMLPGENVSVMADFTDKEIRSPTPGATCAITELGGTPVSMSMDEAKEAFENELLQGILCPTDTPVGFGLGDYVREATFAPATYDFVFVLVMNPDKYDSLPAEVKAILDEVNDETPAYYGQLRTWGEEHGLEYCRTLDGWWEYDLPTADPDEYAAWGDATFACVENFIDGNSTVEDIWLYYQTRCQYYADTEPYASWTPGTAPPEF